jgi:hypothetical protein
MSDSASETPSGTPGAEPQLTAEQQEALRQMEEEMRRVRVQDLIVQSAVSILNLSYRRIAKEDERDLEQARAGIDAVAALTELLEPDPKRELMNALSQVRIEFAKHASEPEATEGAGSQTSSGEGAAAGGEAAGQGRPKPPPGLWVPGAD